MDVSRETPDVTTKHKCCDLTDMFVRSGSAFACRAHPAAGMRSPSLQKPRIRTVMCLGPSLEEVP